MKGPRSNPSAGGLAVVVALSLGLAACQGSSDESSTSTAVPTTTAPLTTTIAAEPAPGFPPPAELAQGGEVWALVLAASEDPDDPALAEAVAAAAEAGYSTGPTDCDVGAAAAVGFPEEAAVLTVSVYLRSEADAHLAQEAFAARGVNGAVALIETFCLD